MNRRYVVIVVFILAFSISCIAPFEKTVYDGETYHGPNGAGQWDIYFPAYSTGWTVELDITGQDDVFDLVVATGMLDWDDYVIKKDDPAYSIYFESFNKSEVEGLIEMDLPSHHRTVRILYRAYENGVTFNGLIIARCLAFRYLGWGNVYDHM